MADPDRYPFTLGAPEESVDPVTRMIHLAFPVRGEAFPLDAIAQIAVPVHHWDTPTGRHLTLVQLRAQIMRELVHDGPPTD